MLDQNELFRRAGLGSFDQLVRDVTDRPGDAPLAQRHRQPPRHPNENYARELMELFTLGADRGAYTEADVRELARALTGWRARLEPELGLHELPLRPEPLATTGRRRSSAAPAHFGWEDAYRLCVRAPAARLLLRAQALGLLHPDAPPAADARGPRELYVQRRLPDPARGRGDPRAPRALPGPAHGQAARSSSTPGCCAPCVARSTPYEWVWLWPTAGQHLFYPPDVAGWNDERWLDTARSAGAGRWSTRVLNDRTSGLDGANNYDRTETPRAALQRARSASGPTRTLTAETRASLLGLRAELLSPTPTWRPRSRSYRAYRQNALRQLIGASPDLQTG